MFTDIYKQLRISFTILLLFAIITGGIYPSIITGIAQFLFPNKANGSFIVYGNEKSASILIGQNFTSPKYFHGRPSVTTPFPYNPMDAKGSNLSPASSVLIAAIKERVAWQQKINKSKDLVPVDLVEASGSGLDPHISPLAAYYQLSRVAKARGLNEEALWELVIANTEGRQFGIFGEPRVNVLRLNLELDFGNSLSSK
jgi:potassium-transporting ATPase KdpC subunit